MPPLPVLPAFAATRKILGHVWSHPANRDGRLEATARMLRFQTRARFLHRPTAVPYGARSRFWARLDDAPSRRAAYAPLPDHAEMLVWQRHLRPGDLFIDIGASVGLYSIMAAELGCTVVAVEPLARSRSQLEANLRLNGYDAEIVGAALSAVAGEAAMVGPDASRAHLGTAGPATASPQHGPGEVVAVRTLDDVLGPRTARGVKIDVEGAERLVLTGGAEGLRSRRFELIQLEWNGEVRRNFAETREPLAELLLDAGYELARPDAGGLLHPISDLTEGADVFARPVVR